MLDLFEIADWLVASASPTSLQTSTDLNTHYKVLKESGWEKYAPLDHKCRLQEKVFGQKKRHLNRPLNDLIEIVSLYVHYAPQSADWQKVQEAVESCHSPALKNYNTQRSKFQKAFDVLCQHLEPLLKDTPKFSTTEELQCWFVLVELERGRCLKAWKAFYKVYKEECKAKGESKLSHSDMSEATESVYNVFVDSLDTLRERVDDFLECADRLSGVHLLAQIPFRILWDEEEDLSMLLEMREAVGAVVSTDAKVCEAKKAVELKIAQCQEELPKCLALLEQAKDKSLKERNTIKKPFKKLQESLETDIQTLFEASDESLGVAVVRRVRGIKKTEFAHNYDQSGFKNALEKEVLKPLEEHFKALGLVVEPKRALGMLQAKMQENIATIPEALLELDKTYQELEKEGIATDKELRTIRKSVEPFLESFEESLQAFVKSTRDKAIIAAGKRILKGLEEAWLSGLEEILPDLEAFMQVAGKSLHGSTASMDAEQMRAFVTERLHAELKRNNVCEHLGNLEVSLKPLQEKAQELQTAIHQNKEDNITPYINGFQQAHQDTLKELKHLLELLDHNTSKELTALSAELDVLDKDLRFQREDYQQESSRQKDYQEDEDLEDTLKILKKAFRQGILKVLEALEAKMPKLHTALENLKTSPFFKALIKPLWFYQGDNFKAYADYLEASQKNNAQAYLELGKMFLKGVVVSSLEKAREHFKKAATLGSIRAITQLGLSYVPENPKEMKEEDAKKATDYLKKALLLGDGMAEAGLKRLSYFDVIEWDGHRDGLIDLVSDVEAMLFSKEVEGERAYVCFFEASAHIDEHDGIDPEYREYSIQPFFEGDGFEDTGLFDEGFCATMQGHNARLHLSILKTIDVVYGKPTKNDYEVAYSDAKEAYLKGIALGSGCCALELAHLELEQLKHFKMKPEKKQNALLEANHRAIGYFKQALEWGYNIAKVPLTDTLDKQKNLLAKASDHPLHAFLAKYESDLKEVASLTFTDKSMGFGGKLDIKAHLSPTFWQHPALKTLEVKTEQKPVSTLKPLWQYGNNTQQAFRDYMEAKKKGDARAWLYLGVMCLQGVVVPPDYYTAVACFEKARDLGELL